MTPRLKAILLVVLTISVITNIGFSIYSVGLIKSKSETDLQNIHLQTEIEMLKFILEYKKCQQEQIINDRKELRL